MLGLRFALICAAGQTQSFRIFHNLALPGYSRALPRSGRQKLIRARAYSEAKQRTMRRMVKYFTVKKHF